MFTTIHLEPSQVPAALRRGYTGSKFQARVCESLTIPIDAGLWDGGSRELYAAVRLEDGATITLTGQDAAPWDMARAVREVALRPGFAVRVHVNFCGKDLGLRFYVHTDDAVKLLPAPVAELSPVDKLVLRYTAHRKSSYMGKDRFQMARDDGRYGYGENAGRLMPTRPEWDAAKDALIARGLLNKAGAITVAGRNAVGSV